MNARLTMMILAAVVLMTASPADAQIYKCVMPDGRVQFTNVPVECPKGEAIDLGPSNEKVEPAKPTGAPMSQDRPSRQDRGQEMWDRYIFEANRNEFERERYLGNMQDDAELNLQERQEDLINRQNSDTPLPRTWQERKRDPFGKYITPRERAQQLQDERVQRRINDGWGAVKDGDPEWARKKARDAKRLQEDGLTIYPEDNRRRR